MRYPDHEEELMRCDPVARLHKMDPSLLEHWNTLSIQELFQYRDMIIDKINALTRDRNPDLVSQMQNTIRDLEDYIFIRKNREVSGVDNSDIIL